MRVSGPELAKLSREALLDLRVCDLKLSIAETWLEPLVKRVCDELRRKGLVHRPHFWLSDEWFSPDGAPGVAIPFYLADKRLVRLERSQMFEVEGGTRRDCMMLLRHECGHALDTAYRLSYRRRWRELFGRRGEPYPDTYRPRPNSRRFVQYLSGWYAQAHPVEDFAETFAVWLDPKSRWRSKYKDWPAIKKLRYVDELMREIAGKKPPVTSRAQPFSVSKLRMTLRTHYKRKRAHYNVGASEAYDYDLKRLFDDSPNATGTTAASLLHRRRARIRERVARWTGAYEISVEYALKNIIARCRLFKLRVRGSDDDAVNEFIVILALHVAHQLRASSWHQM